MEADTLTTAIVSKRILSPEIIGGIQIGRMA